MESKSALEAEISVLEKQDLLIGLSSEQIEKLQKVSTVESFLPNEVIIEEGEQSTDIYSLPEGSAMILKWDEHHENQVLIGTIKPGDMFGEMAFVDQSPRSTSIRASKNTKVLKISIQAKPSLQEFLSSILTNIAKVNIHRLRQSTQLQAKSYEKNLNALNSRLICGKILVYLYLFLGFSIYFWSGIFGEVVPFVPWVVTLFIAFALIKANDLSLSDFGMTLKNWLSVLIVSLVITAAAILTFYIAYYLSEKNVNGTQIPPFFHIAPVLDWPIIAIACFAVELLARGFLQTLFQRFLKDESGYLSTIFNSLILFLLFLSVGFKNSANILLISLPLGIIYAQQKSILGVFIIHFILAVLGLLK